jgi:hypothetical protein
MEHLSEEMMRLMPLAKTDEQLEHIRSLQKEFDELNAIVKAEQKEEKSRLSVLRSAIDCS